MEAVILAAGKGSRFGDITKIIPKPLIHVAGNALIVHTLDALPQRVTSCVVVIEHLGEMIKSFLGQTYRGRPIRYVNQKSPGTGGALWSAKELLPINEPFLVVGSDDIFGKQELDYLTSDRLCYGITYGQSNKLSATEVLFDADQNFLGLGELTDRYQPHYFGVGAYVLDHQIFSRPMHALPNGELSIPHSLSSNLKNLKVRLIDQWIPVNNRAEMVEAEARLRQTNRQN